MKTAIVSNPIMLGHFTGRDHPESPHRLSAILTALESQNLLTEKNFFIGEPAPRDSLLYCHNKTYVDLAEKESSEAPLYDPVLLSTGDVALTLNSFQAALTAVGCSLLAADLVLSKKFPTSFAVVRPPGHHATATKGMGFCLFNNAGITARHLQKKHGLKRILILDWDVHHGNGTQDIFYEDGDIFYFSTHQEDIYPFTGFSDEKGKNKGYLANLNFPISPDLNTNETFLYAYQDLLVNEMRRFKPECILISCGFDAHILDPLGGLRIRTETYEKASRAILEIAREHAEGRVISILEGGYNPKAIAECSLAHVKALSN
ncbi:histone deacetylase [Criblamydia sequanensis]|uniref:Histone deacetylase superfamily protein n=1 Tax=Candidatus Criblamydia sequanensis CRIB-18 TaxID=1437425 RepID=A0A090CYQ4_9BACT|nr:histone deacetylase [Criblamydia sequanensis]CDR33772.1 Histone deacetylase superfamily protein [Criblamydia sequanensis CRIB-18]